MNCTDARFFIEREPWRRAVTIRFALKFDSGELAVAEPLQVRSYKPDEPVESGPMLSLTDSLTDGHTEAALQSLMDELWKIGVRPSDIGTPGHLAATKVHLDDMRAIVAKTLEVKLP